jgi:hypothetical protein
MTEGKCFVCGASTRRKRLVNGKDGNFNKYCSYKCRINSYPVVYPERSKQHIMKCHVRNDILSRIKHCDEMIDAWTKRKAGLMLTLG